jgi:alpha,alpha-trehalase
LKALAILGPCGTVEAGSIMSANAAVANAMGAAVEPAPPSILFGQLFRDVQLAQLFADQKTFCDLIPTQTPAAILAAYAAQKNAPNFSLAAFVSAHFRAPSNGPVVKPALPGEPAATYIAGLWNVLLEKTGDVDDTARYSSLLQLPLAFAVPGGRFREMYYWDSYFTMLGLEVDGRHVIAKNMVTDFAYEIDRYGHIPNGNRTYYLSRSQPPFFSKMVDLMAAHDGVAVYVHYLPELEREYNYWMDGSATLPRGQTYHNVVRLADGTLLNRYWDARDVPRDESYREDYLTALAANRPAADVYRNLRATAESGWDFSSRWLADGKTLATVQTLNLLPVDLNSLLEHLELTLARSYFLAGDGARTKLYVARAVARAAAIRRLMWNPQQKIFEDYSWREGRLTGRITAATLYPLFFDIATPQEAAGIAHAVTTKLLMPNGVATTLIDSTQQWDQPNGWAPLQWIAVSGLNDYGQQTLAATIARRWMHVNLKVFDHSRKFVEKYDLLTASGGGGGEYTTQIGFGWTNGVLRKLMRGNGNGNGAKSFRRKSHAAAVLEAAVAAVRLPWRDTR